MRDLYVVRKPVPMNDRETLPLGPLPPMRIKKTVQMQAAGPVTAARLAPGLLTHLRRVSGLLWVVMLIVN